LRTLRPEIEQRLQPSWKRVTKEKASLFAGTDVAAWLAEQGRRHHHDRRLHDQQLRLATAVGAEELGLAAEILSDASGAIHLANEVGKVSADQLHETLLVLLHSNFAAVASTEAWTARVTTGEALPKSDLGTSRCRAALPSLADQEHVVNPAPAVRARRT
jgi:hypothetical protein